MKKRKSQKEIIKLIDSGKSHFVSKEEFTDMLVRVALKEDYNRAKREERNSKWKSLIKLMVTIL